MLCSFFFFLVLSCRRSLYILKINSLSVVSYVSFFLPFCRLSFHFIYGFLCSAKLLSLIRSRLFIFVFVSINPGDGPKKDIATIVAEYKGNVEDGTPIAKFKVTWAKDIEAPDGIYQASVILKVSLL